MRKVAPPLFSSFLRLLLSTLIIGLSQLTLLLLPKDFHLGVLYTSSRQGSLQKGQAFGLRHAFVQQILLL